MPETKCGFGDTPAGPRGRDALIAHGPTLLVDIGFDPTFKVGGEAPPRLTETALWALVDTGATESCIDNALAGRLQLPVVDRRSIAGSAGLHEVNLYLAQIHIPSLGHTLWGGFAGVDLAAGGLRHAALIGRTFLQHFTMIYSGTTGDVTLFQ